MTTFELNDTALEVTEQRLGWLANWFSKWRRRRHEKMTLGELERMNPYLLRDMGIEPQDVIDALEGRETSALFNPMRRLDRD
jgi:uncharacterized protein YjiS (DUF1127 family)